MPALRPDRRRRHLVRRACALPLLLAGMLPPVAGAGAGGASAAANASGAALERRVKAAFLDKFLGYAEFAPQAFDSLAAPLVLGVLGGVAGAEDMAAELTRIAAGRSVNGRTLEVRALREHDVAEPVHLLFVGGVDDARSERLLRLATAPLTVTECGGMVPGSVINFTIVEERVRFDVSLDAAEKKNIKLSSRLLVVANRVQRGVT